MRKLETDLLLGVEDHSLGGRDAHHMVIDIIMNGKPDPSRKVQVHQGQLSNQP